VELNCLNNVSEAEANESLTKCCGAHRWVEQMLDERPFASADLLFEKADRIWNALQSEDYLEAFTHHPKIGDFESLKKKFNTSTQWEAGEQAGVATATDLILHDLARGNDEYEKKFGYIFIVCATGKTAGEMLSILESRLPNEPDKELKLAAEEQRKITRLRLEKLCQ